MTEPPSISVLIAAYNASAFIVDTLETVRQQTYSHFELVVVDDGSADDTMAVVERYRQAHPDIQIRIVPSANRGMGGARNLCVQEARYEWLAFLDHDDLWYPPKLERVSQVIQQDPDLDIVHHDEHLVEKDGAGRSRTVRTIRYAMPTDRLYERFLFDGKSLSGSATVVRKMRVIEAGMFSENPEWSWIADYDLWLKLAALGCRIRFIDDVLGQYVLHPSNMTKRVVRYHDALLRVLDHHFANWPSRSLYDRYRMRRRKADSLRGAGQQFMRQGNWRAALSYLADSLRLDPLSWKTIVVSGLLVVRRLSPRGQS